MSSSLYQLGRTMARAPWRVFGAWAIIAVLSAIAAFTLDSGFSDNLAIPGTEAQDGLDTLDRRFPELAGAGGQFVFVAQNGGTIDDYAEDISDIMEEVGDVEGVELAQDPFDEDAPGTRNEGDTAILATVQMNGDLGEFPEEALDTLIEIADEQTTDDLGVHTGGQMFTKTTVPLSIAEVIGVIFAFIVLAVNFRGLIPAFVPIVTAIVGVGIAMMVVLAASAGLEIPGVTATLAVMLGLAVGIDYALFIVSRHRDQLKDGEDVIESIGQAIATSGSAVIFAGTSVVIALVGLFVTQIPFLTLMGLAAAFTVALAVAIALTLLPAILGLLGERLRPKQKKKDSNASESGSQAVADSNEDKKDAKPALTTRWVQLVTKVPILTVVIIALGLGALAIPVKDLRLSLPDGGTEPPGSNQRETYDLVTEEFGAGYNSPLLVSADIINSSDPLGVVDDLEERIEKIDHVDTIQLATPNPGGDLAVVVIIPEGGRTEQSTTDLVNDLRAHEEEWERDLDITDMKVTGQTAATIDITDRLTEALVPFAIFVVGLSLVLLTIVFRSIWVPIKASVGYLLSVAVGFGVVTMVFEYGWASSLLGVDSQGPVISFMPIIVMGVLFGLAMDYEVFLVSRMREEYVHTRDARGSIINGFTASANVVIAAALIMIAVFAGFIPGTTFMIQPIALGLAIGVLVDAFVVRMTLVPAVLALLGDRAWKLPGWLDSRLPHLDVEGEGLGHLMEHREWTEVHGKSALRYEDVIVPLLDNDNAKIGPLTGAVAPGTLLVVRSADAAALSTFLAVTSGRAVPSEGRFVLRDSIAPEDIGHIQSQVQLIPSYANVDKRLSAIDPKKASDLVIVVDDVEHLAPDDADPGTDLASRISALDDLLERGATVVVGAAADDPLPAENRLIEHMRDPSRHSALALHRAAPADQSANLVLEGASR